MVLQLLQGRKTVGNKHLLGCLWGLHNCELWWNELLPYHCVDIWLSSYLWQGPSLIPGQTVWDLWWTNDSGVGLYTVIVSPPVLCVHAINAALFRHHTPFIGQSQGCRTCPGLNCTSIKYSCKCTVSWKSLQWHYAHVAGKQCFACSCYKYIINTYYTHTLYWLYC